MAEKQVPQVSRMMGELVAHQVAFNALSKSGRQFVVERTDEAINIMVAAIRGREKANSQSTDQRELKVLRPVVVTQESLQTPFSADSTFFSKSVGVKIYDRGSNFISWFKGKVEEDVPTGDLVPFTLTKSAYDSEIITDLGGEEKAETTLNEIWQLLLKQPTGQNGLLLTNGYANIFYVRDREGKLRAVRVYWDAGDGWYVHAGVLDGYRWDDGNQVFSRNS